VLFFFILNLEYESTYEVAFAYLKLSSLKLGILVNFNTDNLNQNIVRKVNNLYQRNPRYLREIAKSNQTVDGENFTRRSASAILAGNSRYEKLHSTTFHRVGFLFPGFIFL
jgi:hypothetical protein